MELTTELIQEDKTWILKPTGDINARTAHLLWHFDNLETLSEEFVKAGAESLVFDLSKTQSMDSYALRQLLNAQKEFGKNDIRIVLRHPNLHINRLFKIMQFESIYTIEP